MGAHVIALTAPGKILEEEFVVDAATDINFQRVVDEALGIQVADAGHGVDEGTPFSEIGGDTWAAEDVVLNESAAAVEAADIGNKPDAGKAAEGQGFVRAIPSAIALLDDDVAQLAVGNAGVDVSAGKKAVKLCRHWNRTYEPARESQHRGSSFRHEISLPGRRAGKNSSLVNEIR